MSVGEVVFVAEVGGEDGWVKERRPRGTMVPGESGWKATLQCGVFMKVG